MFRDGQEDAIRHVVDGRGRLLVVQKTGWGKSSVYFIATKLLREEGLGPAILISPLLALMRNQIAAAERMGVRALTIHSDNTEDWENVEQAVSRNEVDILLISPERLANEHFRNEVLGPVAGRISMLVVDEAHCISDWGHDFRPHYRFIERMVRLLPANLRLLATTATANQRVMDDLEQILGPKLEVSRGEPGRPSLFLQTLRLPGQAERIAWLAKHLPTIPGSGIVYTLTVRDTEQVAEWLRLTELAKAAANAGHLPSVGFLRDKEGHEIDAIVESGPALHAVEIKSGQTVPSDAFKGLDFWSPKFPPNLTVRPWLVYGGDSRQHRKNATVLPWNHLSPLPSLI